MPNIIVPPYYGLNNMLFDRFHIIRRNSKQTRKLLYFHAKLGYYHGNSRLLPDSIILPQSPHYQRHPKTKKLGFTTHRDEPHQALKPLILSHSSILSPASTQIPMASIGNSRLCRCYTLMTFTPLYPIYPTQFDFRQTGFDKIPLRFHRTDAILPGTARLPRP